MSTPELATIESKLDALLERIDQPAQRFLPIATAADYCGLSPESIRRLLSSGKLTPLRPVKGRIVIDRHELDSFVLGSTHRPRRGRGLRP